MAETFDISSFFEPEPAPLEVKHKGQVFTFRRFYGMEEAAKILADAKDIAAAMPRGVYKFEGESMKVEDEALRSNIAMVSVLSLEPRLSPGECVAVCRKAPSLWKKLIRSITQFNLDLVSQEVEEVEAEKKESPEMDSIEPE